MIFATNNKNKIRELRQIFNDNTIIPLQEVGNRHLTKLRNKGLLK